MAIPSITVRRRINWATGDASTISSCAMESGTALTERTNYPSPASSSEWQVKIFHLFKKSIRLSARFWEKKLIVIPSFGTFWNNWCRSMNDCSGCYSLPKLNEFFMGRWRLTWTASARDWPSTRRVANSSNNCNNSSSSSNHSNGSSRRKDPVEQIFDEIPHQNHSNLKPPKKLHFSVFPWNFNKKRSQCDVR